MKKSLPKVDGDWGRKDMVAPKVWEMGARINVNQSRCGRALGL
ncbi:hypothetical protein [Dethiosulfovibrio salsuginis]|uniref:Uncharacterized protein n=1 Tax=Dethiosulfovibrio salsuginis TaxID=561720 RepID=A0A1X7KYG8_9BACT|nr:hypothetical protein [Dethiosulfovibrio salsuginis]SMG46515.1 hypothetical protein SAMN06275492_1408 [Dethiosulfovibrio salsuginis]